MECISIQLAEIKQSLFQIIEMLANSKLWFYSGRVVIKANMGCPVLIQTVSAPSYHYSYNPILKSTSWSAKASAIKGSRIAGVVGKGFGFVGRALHCWKVHQIKMDLLGVMEPLLHSVGFTVH